MLFVFSIITGIVGGVALFLFGMDVMSNSLTRLAGGQFENFMGIFTDSRFKGWLLGTLVTALVQSSSATVVLTVGLVNSGIIGLTHAVSVIIGANLGTTATAWILSLNSLKGTSFLLTLFKPATFVPYVAIAGAGLAIFSRDEKKKKIGSVLIGFATMMYGMLIMSEAIVPLKESTVFENVLTTFANPVISFLFAIIFTMLVQSSDAVIGILQALVIVISIDIRVAIPIIFGAQIGTCITAIMSSLGAEKNGKRTALIQLYYNLIKNVPFMILFCIFCLTSYSSILTIDATAVSIAVFHSSINIVFSIIMLPLGDFLVKLAVKTIPYDEKELRRQHEKLSLLDPLLIQNPQIAITHAESAVRRLSQNIMDEYELYRAGDYHNQKESNEISSSYVNQIIRYCDDITQKSMLKEESSKLTAIQRICLDYSAISEAINSLSVYTQKMESENISFSELTQKDIKVYAEATREILSLVMCGLMTGSSRIAQTVWYYREVSEDLRANISMRYLQNLNNDELDQDLTIYFTDMCHSYERIATRCGSIAEVLVRFAPNNKSRNKISSTNSTPEVLRELFKDKYSLLKN